MALYRHIILSLAIAFSAVPAPAAAQRTTVQANRWNLDYGDVRCSLSRRISGPQSPIMILSSYLGEDNPELIFMRDGSEALPEFAGRVDVVLLPSNEVRRGALHRRRVQGGEIISVRALGEGFIERFAAASTVRLQTGGRRLLEVAIPQAAPAVAALGACNDDLMRSWGADPAQQPAQMARVISGRVTGMEYPSHLAMNGVGGTTVMRMVVSREGRVTSCDIRVSSGNAELDNQSCGAAMIRFRFEPARNAAGEPVDSIFVQSIRWEPAE